jgi:hypothetical protein
LRIYSTYHRVEGVEGVEARVETQGKEETNAEEQVAAMAVAVAVAVAVMVTEKARACDCCKRKAWTCPN